MCVRFGACDAQTDVLFDNVSPSETSNPTAFAQPQILLNGQLVDFFVHSWFPDLQAIGTYLSGYGVTYGANVRHLARSRIAISS